MNDFFDDNELTPILASTKSPSIDRDRAYDKHHREDYDGQLTVDVYQTEDDIVIQSTIAGVDQNDIDISVANDMVTIKGRRVSAENIRPSDYHYQEVFWGAFSRSVILPEDVDSDNAKASMKNGLLTVRLPKLAKSRMKKVKISG